MLNKTNTWTPSLFRDYKNAEHDACGIVSVMEKRKIPTKENIDLCIQSLVKMNHRAGFINGEGDGIGIHIDVPKALWNEKLKVADIIQRLWIIPTLSLDIFSKQKREYS